MMLACKIKHATTRAGKERSDLELLTRFTDAVNDHTLFVGWRDYLRAVGAMPIEAQVFHLWYVALYSEKLKPEADLSVILKVFPNLKQASRAKCQLIFLSQRLLRIVAHAHKMAHQSATEKTTT